MIVTHRKVRTEPGLQTKPHDPTNDMTTEEEHDLVIKTILRRERGFVEWEDRVVQKATKEIGKSWREILDLIRTHATTSLEQEIEKRPEWRQQFRCWYKLILPSEFFRDGYFMECRLDAPGKWKIEDTKIEDIDFDQVIVKIVNCHEQINR